MRVVLSDVFLKDSHAKTLNYAKLAKSEQEEKESPWLIPRQTEKPFPDSLRLTPKVKWEE